MHLSEWREDSLTACSVHGAGFGVRNSSNQLEFPIDAPLKIGRSEQTWGTHFVQSKFKIIPKPQGHLAQGHFRYTCCIILLATLAN